LAGVSSARLASLSIGTVSAGLTASTQLYGLYLIIAGQWPLSTANGSLAAGLACGYRLKASAAKAGQSEMQKIISGNVSKEIKLSHQWRGSLYASIMAGVNQPYHVAFIDSSSRRQAAIGCHRGPKLSAVAAASRR
jgi:hypothetical protein